MNRKYLPTIVWLVVASLSFALGWTLNRAPESSENAALPETSLIGKSSVDSSEVDARDATEDGPGAGSGTANGDAESGAGVFVTETTRPLSPAEIETLGTRFNTSLDPIERRLAFAQLLEGLTADNALEIRAQIEDLSSSSSEFREFHFAWGKVGGADAVMHGAETEKTDMAATLAGWANANPDAAIKWLENLDMENDPGFDVLLNGQGVAVDRMRSHLVEGMVHGLASTDPERASTFVFALAEAGNPKAKELLGIVTGNVLRSRSPIEAAQWAERLPKGGLRSTAMGRVAYEYARQDPAAAAAWAGAYVHDENGSHLVHGITKQWARQDGGATVAWLESLGETPGRAGAYASAFERWTGQDPVAASEYLSEMPQSPERDNAISGLVSRHRWEDPEAAIVWADSISSERARLEAITRAGQAWTHKDPKAAAAWATASGLPEKLQRAIVNPPRDRKR